MGTTVLNLDGPEAVVDFIAIWKPPPVIFETTTFLVRRLIDAGRFEVIEEIARAGCDSPYIILAICNELAIVGKHPKVEVLRWNCKGFVSSKFRSEFLLKLSGRQIPQA